MHISEILEEVLLRTIQDVTGIAVTAKEIHLEHPAHKEHGDYATHIALVLFRSHTDEIRSQFQSPLECAQALAAALQKNTELAPVIGKIEVAPPGFINMTILPEYLARLLPSLTDPSTLRLNRWKKFEGMKIALEHTQVNPNKAPHVGHLRNACIGDALTRMFRFAGAEVIVQYYQNDIGVQIASLVLAQQKEYVAHVPGEQTISWASRAYQDIETRIESDAALAEERNHIHVKLLDQNSAEWKHAETLTNAILREILQLMETLGFEYDVIVRESDIVHFLWEKAFDLMKQHPDVFYSVSEGERKGCWSIKMKNSEDKIIVRSNGIPTYTGNDIAYHLWKFSVLPDFRYKTFYGTKKRNKTYITHTDGSVPSENVSFQNADAIVNIIDTHQTYPQQAVRESLHTLGFQKQADRYAFVNYGFVYLTPRTLELLGVAVDGEAHQIKMSGRKGTVVGVTDFIQRMQTVFSERYGNFAAITAVSFGAVKYELLKYNTYQDIHFDLESALDQKGDSGPYAQYAYARCMSLLEKAQKSDTAEVKPQGEGIGDLEATLVKKILEYPELLDRCLNEYAPHYLCNYVHELAQLFNTFYGSTQIIGSEQEHIRLALVKSVAETLKSALSVLGIETPSKM